MKFPSTVGADGHVAAADQLLVDRGFAGTGQALHQVVPLSHPSPQPFQIVQGTSANSMSQATSAPRRRAKRSGKNGWTMNPAHRLTCLASAAVSVASLLRVQV